MAGFDSLVTDQFYLAALFGKTQLCGWALPPESPFTHFPCSFFPNPYQNKMPFNFKPIRKDLQSRTSFTHLSNYFLDDHILKQALSSILSWEEYRTKPTLGFCCLESLHKHLFASWFTSSYSSSNLWPLWWLTKSNEAICLEKGHMHF